MKGGARGVITGTIIMNGSVKNLDFGIDQKAIFVLKFTGYLFFLHLKTYTVILKQKLSNEFNDCA